MVRPAGTRPWSAPRGPGQWRKARRAQRCRITATPEGRRVGAMRSISSVVAILTDSAATATKKARGAGPGLVWRRPPRALLGEVAAPLGAAVPVRALVGVGAAAVHPGVAVLAGRALGGAAGA